MKGVLTTVDRELLAVLFDRQQPSNRGVDAKRFRAEFDDHLDEIENLRASTWIELRDGAYFVQLAGIAELAATHSGAADLVRRCAHLFDVLKKAYKRDLDRKLLLTELSELAGASVEQVRQALPYLRQAGLFGGSSIDLEAEDSYIVPVEQLIRHQSFDAVLSQHRRWAEEYISQRRALIPNADTVGVVRTPFEVYTLGRQIGQGGSGYVLSVATQDGTELAAKFFSANPSSETRSRRFRNEIRFGQRIEHPNIVPVLDVGEGLFRGTMTLFFVMPLYALPCAMRWSRNCWAPTRPCEYSRRCYQALRPRTSAVFGIVI